MSVKSLTMAEQVGLGTITVYRGSPNQRGHGVGTFLKGLFRASLPLLKRGARAVGRELMHSGINFLDDLEHEMPAKLAFQQRLSQAQNNLKRKAMDTIFRGKGYKTKRRKRAIQSKRVVRKHRSLKKLKGGGKRKKSSKKVKSRKTKKIVKGKSKRGRKRGVNRNFEDIFT